jgi:putative FmdB family regulatory protein
VTAVPLYDYRCASGHRFEAMAPLSASDTATCPCGTEAVKVPSRISLGGSADAGRPMELMPQTWRGTYEGNREYLGQLRRDWGARQKLEEKYPELSGDRRPIIAHEGRYSGAPLRAGDAVPEPAQPQPHPHPHSHGDHTHGDHTHPHGVSPA